MNLATIQEAFRQAVVLASGVPTGDVFWSGAKEDGYFHNSPRVVISMLTLARVGRDEKRAAFTAPSTRTVAHCGNRRMTLSVRVESDRQDPGNNAQAVASLLATRIDFRGPRALLKAANIAVTDVMQGITRDVVVQSRKLSVSVVDFVVYGAESLVDTDAGNWIETAHGEGELPGALDDAEFDAP